MVEQLVFQRLYIYRVVHNIMCSYVGTCVCARNHDREIHLAVKEELLFGEGGGREYNTPIYIFFARTT